MRLLVVMQIFAALSVAVGSAAEPDGECFVEIAAPAFPPLPRSSHISDSVSVTFVVGPGGKAEADSIDESQLHLLFRSCAVAAVKRSTFAQTCSGRKLTLLYEFRVEGKPVYGTPIVTVSFRPPNRIILSAPPSALETQQEQ
jgi:hypothetical protein